MPIKKKNILKTSLEEIIFMNWLKNLICGRELATLKSEIKQLKKDRERAFYERDKALNKANRLECELSVCQFELRQKWGWRR